MLDDLIDRFLSFVFFRPEGDKTKFRFLETIEIPSPSGAEYLKRWLLFEHPRLGGRCIHRFFQADWTRDPHDHPWKFRTFLLRGWYMEKLQHVIPWAKERFQTILHGPGQRRAVRRANDVHCITQVDPGRTWTWIAYGPRRTDREWGFYPEGGDFVPKSEYLVR